MLLPLDIIAYFILPVKPTAASGVSTQPFLTWYLKGITFLRQRIIYATIMSGMYDPLLPKVLYFFSHFSCDQNTT